MANHNNVAKAWSYGESAKGYAMYTDGTTIYSWGDHFPIAHKMGNGIVLFNNDSYSSSTGKHQSHVRGYLNDYKVYYCDTDEIINAMKTGVVVLHKPPKQVGQALEHLKECCHNLGLKRFPMKVFKQYINDKFDTNPDKKHKQCSLYSGRFSIKHADTWSSIKYDGNTVKVPHRFRQDLCDNFAQYSSQIYRREELLLIAEKVKHNEVLSQFVQQVIGNVIKYSPELMQEIQKDNDMIEEI